MTVSVPKFPAVAALALTVVLLSGGSGWAQEQATTEKVASVNGVTISGAELNREMDIYFQRTGRPANSVPEAQQAQIKSDILDGLIEQELLFQESRKAGIQIDDKTVNDQYDAIKKRYPSAAEFDQALQSMQLSESEVKREIERGLAIRELIDRKVASGIAVEEAESKAFYDEHPEFFLQPERVKASHILIKVDSQAGEGGEKAAAREKLEGIRQQAADGAAFDELAKKYSEGPSSERGGDLGYFQRGQMVKSFEDAAFALEPNQLSDIVETQFGYHLIKVIDKQPEKKLTYDEVKERLVARLKQE
jgi:peptidyl-prolyl cis-trans isomerase C